MNAVWTGTCAKSEGGEGGGVHMGALNCMLHVHVCVGVSQIQKS